MMRFRFTLIISLLFAAAGQSNPTGILYFTLPMIEKSDIKESNNFFNPDPAMVMLKELISSSKNSYTIQLGAFRRWSNAEALYNRVQAFLGIDVKIIDEDGFYKVRINGLNEEKFIYLDPDINTETDSGKNITQVSSVKFETKQISDSLPDTILVGALVSDTIPQRISIADTSQLVRQAKMIIRKFIFLNSNSPWLKRINYFGKSFALVNALIFTIILSIVTMLILLAIILLNRTRMEKEERLRQYLSEKYQSLIIDYLFSDTSPDKFREIASDTYRRQVLIDQMIDVSINLKGDAGQKLIGLYKHLGLDRDSINRAHDYRWHKKIKGFRELAFMNIKEANQAIYKALNSKNEILRMEAQIALVRLSDDDPFGFLSYLTRPFSLWEQITLHDLIIQHNIPVPSFKKWLNSDNKTVAMFALRMIREFKQTEAEENIRETLLHPSPEVRHLAVQVAGDLNMRSTLEIMKRMYKTQDNITCLEIVRSMGKMPDLSLLGFLKLVLDKEDDVQLQIEATKAIENHGEEGVKALVKLMKSEYKNYNIIVRHVLDRRIF